MKGQPQKFIIHPERLFKERYVRLPAIFSIQFYYVIGGVKE